MQKSKDHIRHILLFEYQVGHNASEAVRNICYIMGNGAVSKATACRWFKRFRNRDFSLDDEQRSGRPTEIDLIELKHLIEKEPTLSTREVARRLGCTHSAVQYHFIKSQMLERCLATNGNFTLDK